MTVTWKSKFLRTLAGSLGVLVLARIAIPVSPEGDWMSRLTECACHLHSFDRFHSGTVTLYGHDGEPTDDPLKDGTYRKIAWNTYQWNTAWNKKGPIIVKPGWLFARYQMPGGEGTIWAWRYPLFNKANWIVRESEARAVRKELRKSNAPARVSKPELLLMPIAPVNVLTQGVHRFEFSLSNKGSNTVQIAHWNPNHDPANVFVSLRSRRGEIICPELSLPKGVEEDQTLTLQPGQTTTVPVEVSIQASPGMYSLKGMLVSEPSITTALLVIRIVAGTITVVPSKK
jgi:hypothetical protein